jgi:hypothetical protein
MYRRVIVVECTDEQALKSQTEVSLRDIAIGLDSCEVEDFRISIFARNEEETDRFPVGWQYLNGMTAKEWGEDGEM